MVPTNKGCQQILGTSPHPFVSSKRLSGNIKRYDRSTQTQVGLLHPQRTHAIPIVQRQRMAILAASSSIAVAVVVVVSSMAVEAARRDASQIAFQNTRYSVPCTVLPLKRRRRERVVRNAYEGRLILKSPLGAGRCC